MSERIRELDGVVIHESAYVDGPCSIGKGTKIWHYCHVQAGAEIGEGCVFGQNVNVAGNVRIGNRVKVQNNVSIYTGCTLEDEVFLGPSCVLTNVTNPRSQVNRHSLYEETLFRRGATVGANATIVCGITIGRYAFIGAGAVVTQDVPDYALILGNPGRQRGWMSRHGHLLRPDGGAGEGAGADAASGAGAGESTGAGENAGTLMICPESGFRYQLEETESGALRLRCLDLDEDAPLPEHLASGEKTYDDFKKG